MFLSKLYHIEQDSRKFIFKIQQAQFFEQFISLNRFSTDILPLHNTGHIDWQTSWSCLHFDPHVRSNSTSFDQNAAFIFATKLLLNELPLMAYLQLRKPDLYKEEWNCIFCDQDKQTWQHLWSCSHLKNLLIKLRNDTISTFTRNLTAHDRAPSSGLSDHFTRTFSKLACWCLPQDSPTGFNFSHLVRGFVPTHLVSAIQSVVGSSPNVNKLVGNVLSFVQSEFQNNIWQLHIRRMLDFEKTKGITNKDKRLPFSSSSSVPASRIRHQAASPTTRWHTWISEYMNTGLPWQGFSQAY